ncbi:hypothetical protein ACM66B_006225 [Microbotryomycetes sp. NB124-2]
MAASSSSSSSASKWLTASLPRHPIFTLPDDSVLANQSGMSELARPPSPKLPAIQSTSARHQFNLQETSFSSSTLLSSPARSLFGRGDRATPRAASSSTSAGQQLLPVTPKSTSSKQPHSLHHGQRQQHRETRDGSIPARTATMLVVRGSELVIAVGNKLRIANLQDVKAKSHQARAGSGSTSPNDNELNDIDWNEADYKTLHTPAIDFDILQIVANPTSKILAVVGTHSVAVVVLPRKGWSSSVSKTVECRSLLVGRFYHHLPGSQSTPQVLWHPWGEHASSLLVLSSDATVREYNIAEDVDEPVQTLSFNKTVSNSSSSNLTLARVTTSSAARANGRGGQATPQMRNRGFSAIDEDAETAVGFCLGQGRGDWGPTALYGLMRNGDVKALCPFLPKKASVPASWIHSLSSFVSTKIDYLATTFNADDSLALTAATPTKTPSRIDDQDGDSRRRQSSTLSDLYNQQLQFVNHLVRQATFTSTLSTESMDVDTTLEHSNEEEESSVRIVYPTHLHPQGIKVQGPLLMQPEPIEFEGLDEVVEDWEEDQATSLQYVSYDGSSAVSSNVEEAGGGVSIGALVVAFKSGRVDVCVEVEKVEARWVTTMRTRDSDRSRQRSSGKKTRVGGRRGGYGARSDDDSDSDEDDLEDGVDAPTLLVYETIDLGLLDIVRNKQDPIVEKAALARNHPVIASDSLYNDTVYVHHAFGAHCLCFGPWLESFFGVFKSTTTTGSVNEDDDVEKQVERVVKEQRMTDVVWILQTLPIGSPSERAVDSKPPPAVEGLHVINDVYLGYSVFLLTSNLQLVGIEVPLRINSAAIGFDGMSTNNKANGARSSIADATPGYVSLLEEPFEIPEILTKRTSKVTRLPPPPIASSKKDLVITPQSLRLFGQQVENVQRSIRELVVEGVDRVQSRLELQVKELSRQLDKVEQLRTKLVPSSQLDSQGGVGVSREEGNGRFDDDNIKTRLTRAKNKQEELVVRVDKLLQSLMDSHVPNSLSSFELEWFKELQDVKDRFETSIKLRKERVESRVEDLEPALREIKERERQTSGKEGNAGGSSLGSMQVKVVEIKLTQEAKLISEAKKKLERLQAILSNASR